MSDSTTMRISIERPAYGPYGVGHQEDGKVVLVQGGVPGDVVLVEPVAVKSRMVEARIVEVLEPSPDRREPPCPALPECGGCSWMQFTREAQLRHKQTVLNNTLRKLFNESCPECPAVRHDVHEFGYRQRARLHLQSDGKSLLTVGFNALGTRDIVPISSCPICLPALDRVIGSLARWSPTDSFEGSMEFLADDLDRVVAILYLAKRHPDPQKIADELGAATELAGCQVVSPKTGRANWGLENSQITVQDEPHCSIPVFPGAFSQANRTMNKTLVAHVVEIFQRFGGTSAILELYAGHGNFTFPLASAGFEVQAVETGLRSELLPNVPGVRFTRQDASAFLRYLVRKKLKVEALLLDPPRWGAKEAIPLIIDLSPSLVVYVSCDPNTFARDAGKLVEAGYKMVDVTPFDMMPQTFHAELVGVFQK
jgi:23S rRNA (uracil1939-C5)-methyltransferase